MTKDLTPSLSLKNSGRAYSFVTWDTWFSLKKITSIVYISQKIFTNNLKISVTLDVNDGGNSML